MGIIRIDDAGDGSVDKTKAFESTVAEVVEVTEQCHQNRV
jgi:hypothetical protein